VRDQLRRLLTDHLDGLHRGARRRAAERRERSDKAQREPDTTTKHLDRES
jgi:hypothetical protein